MQPVAPSASWNLPALQLMHPVFEPSFWNLPGPQFGHDPVPAVPAPQATHAVLMSLTAHPAPLLQDEPVWKTSFHLALGHAPQTMFAVVVHAIVRFSPPPQEPHALQDALFA